MMRCAKKNEHEFLIKQAASTEPWKEGEAEELLGSVLQQYFTGKLPENHSVVVWDEDHSILGWSYYAPNMHAEGVWDVWWLGISPKAQRQGYGSKLLKAIETDTKSKGCRVIVIETSSTEPLKKARDFYAKLGYTKCGRVPEFYGAGDDKVIFSKVLQTVG